MLSSCKMFRTGFILSNSVLRKGFQKREIHIQLISNLRNGKRRPLLYKKESSISWAVVSSVRFASNDSLLTSNPKTDVQAAPENSSSTVEEVIPEPPPVLDSTLVQDLAEPTLQSVGLGGWSPVGMVQQCLNYLHMCDIPWWGTIIIGTVVMRLLVFPLVILSQRNAAKLHNNLPEMQTIQVRLTDARQRGDRIEAARCSQELLTFMNKKGINPLKNMVVPFTQAPVFISFFLGLRGMANLPVESMKEGGLYWFTDLTVPDQFYILPIITSATLALTIELGADSAKLNSSNLGLMKYVLRGLPVVIFPFTLSFPSAVLVYWASANFISLVQVLILRVPKVRNYFKIDKLNVLDKKQLPIQDKGFVNSVSESWTNMKIARELEERQRVDEMNFKRAGRGSVIKTYKHDPTKRRDITNLANTMQAKKRE